MRPRACCAPGTTLRRRGALAKLHGVYFCTIVLLHLGGAWGAQHRRSVASSSPGAELRAIRAIAHSTVWGEAVSDQVCQQRDRQAELAAVKSGAELPYVLTGPDTQCDTAGCAHGYWGKRGRYDGSMVPACPMGERSRLAAWLADLADRGSAWAAEALTFKPCDLWPQLRGRTAWFVGDSMSQDMAFALVAFLTEYHSAEQHDTTSLNATVLRDLTHSTAGVFHPLWCHALAAGTRVCSISANKAPRMAARVLPLLPSLADRENDVLILNFGTWYNYNQETDDMLELQADLRPFSEALQARLPELPRRTFWRESAAQHFRTPTGMWDGSVPLEQQRCAPAGTGLDSAVTIQPDGSLAAVSASGAASNDWQLEVMLRGGHRNRLTQPVVDSLGIPTIPLYNLSLAVSSTHNHFHSSGACASVECDCTHVCSPSWFHIAMPHTNRALLDWAPASAAS